MTDNDATAGYSDKFRCKLCGQRLTVGFDYNYCACCEREVFYNDDKRETFLQPVPCQHRNPEKIL